jgi:hypothetical protein
LYDFYVHCLFVVLYCKSSYMSINVHSLIILVLLYYIFNHVRVCINICLALLYVQSSFITCRLQRCVDCVSIACRSRFVVSWIKFGQAKIWSWVRACISVLTVYSHYNCTVVCNYLMGTQCQQHGPTIQQAQKKNVSSLNSFMMISKITRKCLIKFLQ